MSETTCTVDVELPPDGRAPAAARRAVRDASCEAHLDGMLEDVELLVSELVTNGVRYGAPPLRLRVVCDGSTVTVSVSDGSVHAPTPRTAHPDDEAGRGMTLVDYISDDWGVEAGEAGKCVWFTLRR